MSLAGLRLNSYESQISTSRIKSSSLFFVRKNLALIVTSIALSAITLGAFCLYRRYQDRHDVLLQPVKCYFEDTPEKEQQAFNFYTQEANTGDPAHQYCLARMYYNGIGTSQSYDKARDLFKSAAQQGLLDAQQALCKSCKLYRNANIIQIQFEELSALAEACQAGAKCIDIECERTWAYHNPNYICIEECKADRSLPGCENRV